MKNIILTGYMGSGKTTTGMELAKRLEFTFVDTDGLIENRQRRSISQIFAADGEAAFRDMETALLRQMIDDGSERLVISTGGGMPVREENRRLLSALGTVVYLKAEPCTIYDRIKNDTTRPLLQCADPMAKICEMTAQREPAYSAAASVIVQVDGLEPSAVSDEVIRRITS